MYTAESEIMTNFKSKNKMKSKFTLSLFSALIVFTTYTNAQDVSGFETIYYGTPEAIEAEGFSLEVKNPIAKFNYCKMGLTLTNTSNDFILFKPEESTFKYEFGEIHPSEKTALIKPNDSKTKTINVDGSEKFLQSKFSMEVGGIYKIPVNGAVTQMPSFQLPASTNSLSEGKFKIVLRKYDASTKEAKAQFECTYMGDGVALVNPANLSVTAKRNKSNEEVTYANDDKKGEAELMRKGDVIKFDAEFHIPGKIVDMQFATMQINWNDTFTETKEIPLPSQTFDFKMNEALTNEKK